jgi:Fic family protein
MPFDRLQPYNDLPLLPPAVELETKAVLKEAIEANRMLANLRGLAAQIPNQGVLINSIVLQEARLSSEIENIVTTNDELYRADAHADGATDAHTKEVLRYREALKFGFDALKNRPLTTNLFVDMVRIIKQQDIGVRRTVGTALKDAAGEVVYTPPVGEALLRDKLTNLEQFIHADDGLDPLVKMAVQHYQFEAIHALFAELALYEQVKDFIARKIQEGAWRAGDRLPSDRAPHPANWSPSSVSRA